MFVNYLFYFLLLSLSLSLSLYHTLLITLKSHFLLFSFPLSPLIVSVIIFTDEVDKLLAASFIQEVYYPDWLANVVLVKKENGKCRMCVDFIDLNSACPKDSFPLPRIDQLVDSIAGHKLLTFMDIFSGYNQIKMSKEDQEKTTFITTQELYCYKVMPFELKNAGVIYQRLVNKMFSLGTNYTPIVSVYNFL